MSVYVDINTKYDPISNVNKAVVKDLENIKISLERLLTTRKGSVPFNREYGSNLRSLVFENNVDYSTVKTFLYLDICKFEPRVDVNVSDIKFIKTSPNTIVVECNFVVPAIGGLRGSTTMTLRDE